MQAQTQMNLDMAISANAQGRHEEALAYANMVLQETLACPAAWIIKAESYGWLHRHTTDFTAMSSDCWLNAYQYARPEEKEAVRRLVEQSIGRVGLYYVDTLCSKYGAVVKGNPQKLRCALSNYSAAVPGESSGIFLSSDTLVKAADRLIDTLCSMIDRICSIPCPTDGIALLVYTLAMTDINVSLSMLGLSIGSNTCSATPEQEERLLAKVERLAQHTHNSSNLTSTRETRRINKPENRASYARRVTDKLSRQWQTPLIAAARNVYWIEHSEEKAALDEEMNARQSELHQARGSVRSLPSASEKERVERELRQKESELNTMGLFKFKAKAELRSAIEQLTSDRRRLERAMDEELKKAQDRVRWLEREVRALQGKLDEPEVTIDDHIEPLPCMQDGMFTVNVRELSALLQQRLEGEYTFDEISDETSSVTFPVFASQYSTVPIHAVEDGKPSSSYFTFMTCLHDSLDMPVRQIRFNISGFSINEEEKQPEKMLPMVSFLSRLLCMLCPSVGLTQSQSIFAEAFALRKRTLLTFDGLQLSCCFSLNRGLNSSCEITFTPKAFISDVTISDLSGITSGDVPATAENLKEIGMRALKNNNHEDLLRYGEMLLRKEPDNAMAMLFKAIGLSWTTRSDELHADVSPLLLRALELTDPGAKDEMLEQIQQALGQIGNYRMKQALHSFLDNPCKETAERTQKVASSFNMFCFGFEAECGRTLNARTVIGPVGAMLGTVYEAAKNEMDKKTYSNNPTKLEQVNDNNWLVSLSSTLTASAWITAACCLIGTHQKLTAYANCSSMERAINSALNFCGNAYQVLSNQLRPLKEQGKTIGLQLASSLMEPSAEHKALLANWPQPFTLRQLADAVSSMLPPGYSLQEDEPPQNVTNGTNPYREQRFYLYRRGADGVDASTGFAVVGECDQADAPVRAVYVEGVLNISGTLTTADDVGCYAMLSTCVLKCLCPSMTLDAMVEYGVGILCDGSYASDVENVHLEQTFGLSILNSPARMHLTKAKPKEEKNS